MTLATRCLGFFIRPVFCKHVKTAIPAIGMYWTIRRRIFLFIITLTLACLIVASVTITLLYQAAFEEEGIRLSEITHTQARLIEAVARFDQLYSAEDHPQGSIGATLSQIIDAHKSNNGFGQTGEMTLARREEDQIVWIVNHRHLDFDRPQPVPMAGPLAEPMQIGRASWRERG